MDGRRYLAVTAAMACLGLAHALVAEEITWQGLNYNLDSTATDLNDGANWSSGTVPGPGDSVRFLFYGKDGFMGDLHVGDADTNFSPDGSFVFLANHGGETHKQTFDIYVDKPLILSRLRITTYAGSSNRDQDRLRIDMGDNDGASLTLTGEGEALDLTGAGWDAISTYGDIHFTGNSITFSDSSRGGSIKGPGEITFPSMYFDNPSGSIYLGSRAGGTLALADMGFSVRSGQTWAAHTNAYVSLYRNGTRSILDSPDAGRLDNLGEVDLRITHRQYGPGSTLTLRGGSYGSLYAGGGGSRTFTITLAGDVVTKGRFPLTQNGLRVDLGQLITSGHGVRVMGGNLVWGAGGSANAAGTAFFVNGDLVNVGGGINGNPATVVALTGSVDNRGVSTTGSGLHLSTVNAVGGGAEQRFEVGDDANQAGVATASFSIGTLNVGLGTTNALVKLVNNVLNDNPVVMTNATDRIGEKLVVGSLNVNAGSTLDVNGQIVNVNSLSVAPDAWLDLNGGGGLEDGQLVTSFVGFGNKVAEWSVFADRVKDSSQPNVTFVAAKNTATTIETPVGGAAMLAFDGINDHVEVPADGLGTGTISAFTVELWLRVDTSVGGWGYAMHRCKDENVGTSVYWLGVHGADSLSYGAAVNGKFASGDTGVPIDNGWHHLALAYDGTSQRVYLDGVLKNNAIIGAISNQRTSNKIGIGVTPFAATKRPIGGNIVEVRVWNYERTEAEIRTAMNAQLTGNESGLVGYWPLDDGAGTSVADESNNANLGLLRNGLSWDGGDSFTFWQVVGLPAGTLLLLR